MSSAHASQNQRFGVGDARPDDRGHAGAGQRREHDARAARLGGERGELLVRAARPTARRRAARPAAPRSAPPGSAGSAATARRATARRRPASSSGSSSARLAVSQYRPCSSPKMRSGSGGARPAAAPASGASQQRARELGRARRADARDGPARPARARTAEGIRRRRTRAPRPGRAPPAPSARPPAPARPPPPAAPTCRSRPAPSTRTSAPRPRVASPSTSADQPQLPARARRARAALRGSPQAERAWAHAMAWRTRNLRRVHVAKRGLPLIQERLGRASRCRPSCATP